MIGDVSASRRFPGFPKIVQALMGGRKREPSPKGLASLLGHASGSKTAAAGFDRVVAYPN
jgi:hypothetical protein